MLESGVSIAESISALQNQCDHIVLLETLEDLDRKVNHAGWKLSNAMSEHRGVFPPQVIMLVSAGEVGGNLAGRLRKAGELLEREDNLAKQVRTALTGPAFTLLCGGAVAFAVVKFVMPKFLGLYDNMGVALPLISRLVIGFVNLVNHWAFLLALLAGWTLIVWRRRAILEWLYTTGLKTPKVCDWMGIVLCAQLTDILGTLVDEGVPLLKAMSMLSQTAANPTHRSFLEKASRELASEGSLTQAMEQVPYFPTMFYSVCTVAEETGAMSDMFRSLNRLLQQEMDVVIDSVIHLVEPLTISILGAFMAVLFVGMFLPIYGLLSSLG